MRGAGDEAIHKSLEGVAAHMEQALWPEEYERMTREVEEALREADDSNAKSYTHEEVIPVMRSCIARARGKPC